MALQVLVETEKPGIVSVRAIAPVDRQNDSRPVAGFFVRRRYHGDVFMLAKWQEFSPHWMEFVSPPPQAWVDNIKAKFGEVPEREDEEAQEKEPEQFSMGQASRGTEGTINYATGQIKRRPGRPKQSLNLE